MENEKVYRMNFSKIYPLLVNKAVKKGRAKEEVDTLSRRTEIISTAIFIAVLVVGIMQLCSMIFIRKRVLRPVIR